MASGDYRRQWHYHLPLALLNYNTTYHATVGCEPSRIFHGRIPYNILDHKLGLLESTKKNIMQPYWKYKENYDRKAKAALLRQNDYCFILQPIADREGSEIRFREYRLTGPYIVENVLPIENYIVRNSNKTQILHRIYEPSTVLQDIRPEGNLQPDDEIIIPQNDSMLSLGKPTLENFPIQLKKSQFLQVEMPKTLLMISSMMPARQTKFSPM